MAMLVCACVSVSAPSYTAAAWGTVLLAYQACGPSRVPSPPTPRSPCWTCPTVFGSHPSVRTWEHCTRERCLYYRLVRGALICAYPPPHPPPIPPLGPPPDYIKLDFLRLTQEQQWKQMMDRINRLRGVRRGAHCIPSIRRACLVCSSKYVATQRLPLFPSRECRI